MAWGKRPQRRRFNNQEDAKTPAKPFLHQCEICNDWGAFGYGVRLLHDKPGHWFCLEHRPTEEQQKQYRREI